MTEFPGFWDWLRLQSEIGVVGSIAAVKRELESPNLVAWAESMPASMFRIENAAALVSRSEITDWVNSHEQYGREAKNEFLRGADCPLIAEARISGSAIVTYEAPAPDAIRSIKIPDVCREFGVECVLPEDMLSREGARFVLDPAVRASLVQG